MKLDYDNIADALYFRMKKGRVAKTVKLEDRLLADVDKKGNILGIEILGVRSQMGKIKSPLDFHIKMPALA